MHWHHTTHSPWPPPIRSGMMCPVFGVSPAPYILFLQHPPVTAALLAGELVCSVCGSEAAANMMAITGPPPTAEEWGRVPQPLQHHAKGARFFGWEEYSKYKGRLSESFFEW